jgi:hypothetical protein
MKSQSMQELVKKLFNEEKTKAQFIANPESVLSHYALTEQEKKAVLNTQAKMGLVTGDSMQLEAAIRPTTGWNAPLP